MKKYVVLGVNENVKYLYYLPLVCWAWRKFGWVPIVFYTAGAERTLGIINKISSISPLLWYYIPPNQYNSATQAQVSRLYGACVVDKESFLFTSDIDMLPLTANSFHYEGHRVLTIGRDLTDYHYPICYVGARSYVWSQFMEIESQLYTTHMMRDMRQQQNMWGLDQDILTERLLKYGIEKIHHINRGVDKRTGYPLGRVDRSNWHMDHAKLIDAHLPHDTITNPQSFEKVMNLCKHVWPHEDFKWYEDYHNQFKLMVK